MDVRSARRLVAWEGPDPQRVDVAHLDTASGGLVARGTSLTAEYALDWVLETAPDWVTRSLAVRVRGDGWHRDLLLSRRETGWTAARTDGDGAREHQTLADSEFAAALDCDLALCPLTNTMPVLRHDLVAAAQRGEALGADLVMAWVAVPELTVTASAQRYTVRAATAEGGALIDFASNGFQATIEFDRDGLVRSYPGIGQRVL